MRLSIAEIVKKTVDSKGKDEKIDVLRKNNSQPLRMILRYTYDPKIKFNLPDVRPPWNRNGLVDIHGMLYTEARQLRLFIVGGPYDGRISRLKTEMKFIEMLESVDDKDAEILANMIEKKPIKGITKAVLEEAFPGIFEEKFY